MENFEKSREKKPASPNDPEVDNVVDIAVARMKSGAVVREERHRKIKFALFAAMGFVALFLFSQLDFVYQNPSSETAANGDIVITLKQGPSGHYMATGKVNGEPVKFIVDTGASDVALPLHVAERIGLPLGRKMVTKTANGMGTAYETGAETVQLGDIILTNVRVSATEGLLGEEALLGMSFLKRTKVEQENGVMRITY